MEQTNEALRWIILFPLIGAVINGLLVRSKKVWIAGGIATAASALAFATSVLVLMKGGTHQVDAWFQWFQVGRVSVPFSLEWTPFVGLMLLVITGIGSLIHVYAIGYMSHEKSPYRFFSYLNLFLTSMLVLVLSSNLVGVFLGWEGVGLCSYLLIGYWFEKDENAAAGMKAFLTNRVGDLGFLIAIFYCISVFGTTEISKLINFEQSAFFVPILIGLAWASTGKSAQVPLYVWLPDAMAGPTPVSALIHAATMVTSGIVLATRLWPMFEVTPDVLTLIMWIGVATAWLAALIAITQNDIKKVLAYSTVSQLGFMFAALGAGSPTAAFFHVVTHACFKALLFLGAGSVIHGMHEEQDMRQMGGLRKKMPWTHITFLIGTAAIIGFPFSSGFFSKDMILAVLLERDRVAFVAMVGAALVTAFYMLRCYTLTFWGAPRSSHASHAHESGVLMIGPLVVLAVLSAFVGWIETPPLLGGIHALDGWVRASWPGVTIQSAGHHMSLGAEALFVLVITGLSLGTAYVSFKKYGNGLGTGGANVAIRISQNKFYVDEIYQVLILKPLSCVASGVTRFVEGAGINGVWHGLRDSARVSGQVLSFFHSGSIQTYVWFVCMGVALALLGVWVLG